MLQLFWTSLAPKQQIQINTKPRDHASTRNKLRGLTFAFFALITPTPTHSVTICNSHVSDIILHRYVMAQPAQRSRRGIK